MLRLIPPSQAQPRGNGGSVQDPRAFAISHHRRMMLNAMIMSKRPGDPAVRQPSAKRARVEKPAPNLVAPSSIVTVHVRREQGAYTTFNIHSNYICHYSPFFQAAFNGNFQEAEKKEMHLEETDPLVFGIFANWLYSQKIHNEKGEVPECAQLIDVWIFGDKYLMPRLQNQALLVLDDARTKAKKLSSSLYKAIYDGTNAQSHLRMYLIDYCVNSTVDISCPESYPIQLLVDIINTTRAERRGTERATRRWDMLPEYIEDYFVDENVDVGMEQRHGLSEGIKVGNTAGQPANSGAEPNLTTNLFNDPAAKTAMAGPSQTVSGNDFSSYIDLDSDDSILNENSRAFRSTA